MLNQIPQLFTNQSYTIIIEQSNRDKIDYEYRVFVIPVSFNEWGKELLGRFQHVVSKTWLSIFLLLLQSSL